MDLGLAVLGCGNPAVGRGRPDSGGGPRPRARTNRTRVGTPPSGTDESDSATGPVVGRGRPALSRRTPSSSTDKPHSGYLVSCPLVSHPGTRVWMDARSGTLGPLRHRTRGEDLDAIWNRTCTRTTHLHADHDGGPRRRTTTRGPAHRLLFADVSRPHSPAVRPAGTADRLTGTAHCLTGTADRPTNTAHCPADTAGRLNDTAHRPAGFVSTDHNTAQPSRPSTPPTCQTSTKAAVGSPARFLLTQRANPDSSSRSIHRLPRSR